MFNYVNPYNPQISVDRINNQIAELEKMKTQIQQPIQPPTSLTQNFQIAPTNRETIRYANNIEEVQKELVIGDTPYFSKDMTVLWVKNNKGDIKSYELSEIIPKDAKDMQIELLQAQINELKGKIENDANVTNANAKQDETDTSTNDGATRTATKKNKSTSV